MGRAEQAERALVVHVPDWPVVAAGHRHDEPVVVVHANRVVAASAAARAEGVVVGLRRREAQARAPSAQVVAAESGRDGRRFEPLAAALDALTPRVEVTRPGTVAFGTRGPSRYHGGDVALLVRVVDVLAPLLDGAAPVRVGVADGTFAAQCAATVPTGWRPPTGLAAVTPAGVVVASGRSASFLAEWPVGAAAVHLGTPGAVEAAEVLARLGIARLGALAALPGPEVLGRFGTDGALLHRLARGVDPRPLSTRRPAPEMAVETELDPPADRVDLLAFRAVTLAAALHDRLRGDGLSCLRVAVEVETEHGELRRRSWRHEGGLSAAAVAERARWQLDGWLSGPVPDRPRAGVTRLRLDPEEVVAARGRQLGFWGGETRLDEGAARALARVAALLGPEAVRVPELTGGRGPGDRVRLVPTAAVDLGEDRTVTAPGAEGPWPGRLPAPSPALVLPEPEPVELRDAAGETVRVGGRGEISAPPIRLGRVEVVGWAGPWPVEEHWWDAERARRRARVQVVLSDGSAHLLSVEGGRWHREATYD